MGIKTRVLCSVLFFGLLAPEAAHAFIDPGLGSMLLQGLAAGVISVLVFWRELRRKIVAFFTGKGKGTGSADGKDDAES